MDGRERATRGSGGEEEERGRRERGEREDRRGEMGREAEERLISTSGLPASS